MTWKLVFLVALAALSGPVGAQMEWQPPPQGGLEMSRELPRAFHVGGASGGAGGEGDLGIASQPVGMKGLTVRAEMAPVGSWDTVEGPAAATLPQGVVRFYRVGEYEWKMEAPLGEDVNVPPGGWYLLAEAPGWVSTTGSGFWSSSSGGRVTKVLPGVPACRVRIDRAEIGERIDRVDFVAIDEASVYPWVAGQRREVALPAGGFFAYAVRSQEIAGWSQVKDCDAGEVVDLGPISPPPGSSWASVVHLDLPPGGPLATTSTVAVRLASGEVIPVEPVARLGHRRRVTLILLGLPAGVLEIDVPGYEASAEWPRGIGGEIIELSVALTPVSR